MRPHPSSLSHVARAVIVTASVAGFIGGCDREPEPAPASAEPVGPLELLTDPFLQRPEANSVEVAWFTEFAGDSHHVLIGERVGAMSDAELRDAVLRGDAADVTVFPAESVQLSRVAEDGASELPAHQLSATGITAREVFRYHANVEVPDAGRQPYQHRQQLRRLPRPLG
ncbi:hypothetical protein [Mycolicibacterium hippocampi]|uniref:hypothetical protein n=1 Tax=Mycolicibacterium hippocampi TaxID=659824 RepID=UPI003516123B